MDPHLLTELKEIGGDPYAVLGVEHTADAKQIRHAFKVKSRLEHPDKSKHPDANIRFHRIKVANEILTNDVKKRDIDRFLSSKKEQEARHAEFNKERSQFAHDLRKREEEAQRRREARHQEEMFHKMEKRRKAEKDDKKEEEKFQEEEAKRLQSEYRFKEQVIKYIEGLKEEQEKAKLYNSVKVKWPKDGGVVYTESLLRMIFSAYGAIKDVAVLEGSHRAVIEFASRHGAEAAAKDHERKIEEKSFDDALSVKLIKKKSLKEEHAAKGEPDLGLNSKTIERIASVMNKGSTSFIGTQREAMKREMERQRLIGQIINEVSES